MKTATADVVRRVEARLGARVIGPGVYRPICCVCSGIGGEGFTRGDGVFVHDGCLGGLNV